MRISKKKSILVLIFSIILLNSIRVIPSGVCFEMIWKFKAGDWTRDVAISDDGSTIAAVVMTKKFTSLIVKITFLFGFMRQVIFLGLLRFHPKETIS